MGSVLSLFSGIGGIDLGLESIGYQTKWYSEVDSHACRVMRARFPEAVNLGDITKIDWRAQEHPDVICGGFPCQDISLAGKGAGIDGDRSGLWRYYADAVRVLRPRGVLVENVAALTNRGLGRVLGDLHSCGYDAEWDCIPAGAVGAPHLRDRVFVIAYRPDTAGSVRGGSSIADSDCYGRNQGFNGDAFKAGSVSGEDGSGGQAGLSEWPRAAATEQWAFEPGVGRVVDGFPDRVDRLRCLGNAVVPQVAEHVARILHDRVSGGFARAFCDANPAGDKRD